MATNLKNGYGISFNEWVLDNDIKNDLRLLLIISSLSANKGFTNATNTYFAELFNETEENISRKINDLQKKKYIEIEYVKTGTVVTSRIIRLIKISTAVDKNIKEINNNKNKENNISKDILQKKEEKFTIPTLEEIENYCKERNNNVDAKTFYDYFNEGGWKDSKGNKVKNWKQKIITWEKMNNKPKNSYTNKPIPEWVDRNIETDQEEQEETFDKEFQEFLKEFRNEQK